MFLVLFVEKSYVPSLDFKADLLILKMTFNHQNRTRNGVFSGNHFSSKIMCFTFLILDLTFRLFGLQINLLPLKMTLSHEII